MDLLLGPDTPHLYDALTSICTRLEKGFVPKRRLNKVVKSNWGKLCIFKDFS